VIYNNLLFFLVVILIFSTSSIPQSPQIDFSFAIFIFLLKAFIYQRLVRRAHRDKNLITDSMYFALEQKFTIAAVISFGFDIYLLDAKYYLARIPLADHIPVLIKIGGLTLFFFYLCILWATARRSYQDVFGLSPDKHYTPLRFLAYNIKNNLPIILPWFFITFTLDLFQLIPLPLLEQLPLSQWAEPITFILFFLFLATVFPVLVKYLWNCSPFPAGPVKDHIKKFCHDHGFTAEILLWPLFEGRVITAGVMGISKRFRYLLITPALINALNTEELEAVLAHEIGHVKKHHLQLYLVLFLGFGLLLSLIANPLLYLLLNTNFFYTLISFANNDLGAGIAFWGTVPLFLIMLFYFRYIFAFFMRNFERQADLYVFKALGDSSPLINSFEKIGALTGKRDTPSWHHFGIGQRIDFLEKCQKKPSLIRRHTNKIYFSLLLYVVILVGGAAVLQTMPVDLYESGMEVRFVEAVLSQKIRQEPDNALWQRLLGDLQQERKKDLEAIAAYSKALALEPSNPEIMNNYAWILLVAEKKEYRDPVKALSLAVAAANRSKTGYILDTLATAYWANGEVSEAVNVAKQAILRDPANSSYYEEQIKKFTTSLYE
jgi:Zn-dependent protease with chaperone function